MRLVVDSNILISAILATTSLPAHLIALWREHAFDLLTSPAQLDELMLGTRYPKIRERLTPAIAGRLINAMRKITVMIHDAPAVAVCADPYDNYLLGIAKAGRAAFLVAGDKRHVLTLQLFEGTRILTVRDFLTQIGRLP